MHRFVLPGALAVAVLGACSIYELEVSGLAIDSPRESILIGDTVRMVLSSPNGLVPPAAQVAWSTSDESVATVDDAGHVRGIANGWVRIGAVSGGHTVGYNLRVWSLAPEFTAIEAGAEHTCALTEDGRAWCWGSNVLGQLGYEPPDLCSTGGAEADFCSVGATPVDTDLRFESLALGAYHSCGLTSEGTAYCWGWNSRGQLGDGTLTTTVAPTPVSGGHTFTSLAAAYNVTCGVTDDEALQCWGSGRYAIGTTQDSIAAPIPAQSGETFSTIAMTADHSCGLAGDGTVTCWGVNGSGQVGVDGELDCPELEDTPCTPAPQTVTDAPMLEALAVDRDFSCGLSADGRAHCWGQNEDGRLGDGTVESRFRSGPVDGGRVYTSLSAGDGRACGVESGGALYCWGFDAGGFGRGDGPTQAVRPMESAPGRMFDAVTVGFRHTCALGTDGVTWCWGANGRGELGGGYSTLASESEPVRVTLRADGS